MIFAIVALALSFIVMTVMIAVKLKEIKVGQKIVAVPARSWFDKHMHIVLHSVYGIVQVATTKRFWIGLTSFAWRKFVEKIWYHPHVQKVTKKAVDVVKGKKEIKPNGPVSYYLKDVSEYKKDLSV